MPQRLAILVAYGPEARAMAYSGLAERLASSWSVVFAATEPDAPALSAMPGSVLAAPSASPPAWLTRLRRLRARLASRRAAAATVRLGVAAGAWLAGGSSSWRSWLQRRRIDAVLAASHSSARTLPALDAAARLGIPAAVCANSWKDTLAKPCCDARLGALGVFTERERLAFLDANPGFRADRVAAVGSLHCAALVRATPVSRDELLRPNRLNPARPFIAYLAARDGQAEVPRIEALRRALTALPQPPQLLVRLNPMDHGDWVELYRDCPDIGFDRPRWDWRPARDWSCPLPEDSSYWAALLLEAGAIVSSPSTAVWEAAALGRVTLTPAWGEARPSWEADGFREARERGWVQGVDGRDALQAALARELRSPARPADPPADDAVERACALLDQALRPAVAGAPLWACSAEGGAP